MTDKGLRDACLQDFWTFCEKGLEMPLRERPHHEMVDFISDDSQKSKLMLVPRDCWKTSICSTAYPLWMVLRAWFIDHNPSYRCMIDSETVRLSEFVLEAIDNYVQHGFQFHKIFGDLYSKELHKANRFSLKFAQGRSGGIREPNFLASGVNAAKTGLHFDLICLDDLVTIKNYATLAQREKVWVHYRMIYGIVEADSSGQSTMVHVVGTRYHDDDMYGRILKAEAKGAAEGRPSSFATMVRGAVDDEGELFYPDVLTTEELARRKDKMQGLFWAQFMNDPNKDNAPFKADQLKFKSATLFPALTKIRLTVDAAIKEEDIAHGDYNAMMVGGWDKWSRPWIYDVDLRRDLSAPSFIDAVLDMAGRWNVEQIIIESINEATLGDLFRMEMMRRGRFFSIFYVKTQRLQGKLARWKRLQPFAERGGIHFAEELPETTKLEVLDQWSRAPFAQYDDVMDALELQLTFMPMSEGDGSDEAPSVARTAEEVLDQKQAFNDHLPILENLYPHLRLLRAVKTDEELENEPSDLAEEDRDLLMAEQGLTWQ